MGVESDRLVFDYLSRVGDLAQTALPAADRMRLVNQLRKDIEQARGDGDNPASVQRILGRFGSPDEVVEAAAGSSGGAGSGPGATSGAGAHEPPAGEPAPGSYGPYAKRRAGVPKARAQDAQARPRARDGREPEWWGGGLGEPRLRSGDEVAGLPGMTGGIFIPFDDEELAGKGPGEELPRLPGAVAEEAGDGAGEGGAADGGGPAVEGPRRRKGLRGLLRPGGGAGGGARARVRRWGSPMLLLAAALLVAGAVIGSWIPLGLGWLAGYLSRALTRTQAKIAVFGVPGATAVGYLVWFWGRGAGRWGTPVAQGQMGNAVQDVLPTAVRIAAIGSAVYFVWRARRSA
ncbi:hypothetical protein SAMN05216223_104330 [Actinacidiphila yanglinensis]|uniref:Uncharacterized protein n=1 Tax=Actinacidiphila yanglinensis TaxID=310779 RepID=A0A1H5Z7S1_9ACTN|nr:hypothetical protein [Actinacidiphila yanglinensis]SEG31755.1 hypothetical protein SAMN05216223_104330 [Actinacidiphila yanglinensis]